MFPQPVQLTSLRSALIAWSASAWLSYQRVVRTSCSDEEAKCGLKTPEADVESASSWKITSGDEAGAASRFPTSQACVCPSLVKTGGPGEDFRGKSTGTTDRLAVEMAYRWFLTLLLYCSGILYNVGFAFKCRALFPAKTRLDWNDIVWFSRFVFYGYAIPSICTGNARW